MSQRIAHPLPRWDTRPTPQGPRRNPRGREAEQRRPSAVYRTAIEVSLSRMVVLDRIRESGFSGS